jgi:phage gp46-like protein
MAVPLSPFVDIAFQQDAEGVFDIPPDLDNDDCRDVELENNLYSAIVVSLFTDRRARPDEVADPMKRRGWIGDLVSDVPDDRIGSGLWLYEQRRLTDDVVAGIAAEARNALQWMLDDGLCDSIDVQITRDPVARDVQLSVKIGLSLGGVTQHSFILASATQPNILAHV